MKKTIVQVGSYPPPYGGISVHIQKLYQIVSDSFHVKVIDLYGDPDKNDKTPFVYHCGKRRLFNLLNAVKFLKKIDAEVIHFHVSAMQNFVFSGHPLLWSLNPTTKKVLTIHSGSFVKHYQSSSHLTKKSIVDLIRKFDYIIVVNDEGLTLVENIMPRKKISKIPAFLPPTVKVSTIIQQKIDLLKQKSSKVLLVSGYALKYYGFHLVLDALEFYKERKKDFAIVFAFYNVYDDYYVERLENRLKNSFNYTIFKDLNPDHFAFLLSLIDVYIRPTDRDGDAVALREAAYFRKQIIASDCIKRPSKVLLFKTMKAESLKKAIDQVIQNQEIGLAQFSFEENKEKILKIYDEITRCAK